MTKTSELTNEMISDYMRFSEKRVASVEEYMLFRTQAILELSSAPDSAESVSLPPTKVQKGLAVSPQNASEAGKNEISKSKSETMSHYICEDNERAQENFGEDNTEDDDFLACVNRIED